MILWHFQTFHKMLYLAPLALSRIAVSLSHSFGSALLSSLIYSSSLIVPIAFNFHLTLFLYCVFVCPLVLKAAQAQYHLLTLPFFPVPSHSVLLFSWWARQVSRKSFIMSENCMEKDFLKLPSFLDVACHHTLSLCPFVWHFSAWLAVRHTELSASGNLPACHNWISAEHL